KQTVELVPVAAERTGDRQPQAGEDLRLGIGLVEYEVPGQDFRSATAHHGLADDVLQLPDISRPLVIPKPTPALVSQGRNRLLAGQNCFLSEEMVDKRLQVGGAMAQRGQDDGLTGKIVEQFAAEFRLGEALKVTPRSRDDTNVHAYRLIISQPR